jgi:hypothetical protein
MGLGAQGAELSWYSSPVSRLDGVVNLIQGKHFLGLTTNAFHLTRARAILFATACSGSETPLLVWNKILNLFQALCRSAPGGVPRVLCATGLREYRVGVGEFRPVSPATCAVASRCRPTQARFGWNIKTEHVFSCEQDPKVV